MTKLPSSPYDHTSRLIVSFSVGVLVLALVILVALLVDDTAVDGCGW
ncbi:hypothetical protein [Streptomyces sp. NPDC088760]